MFLFPSLLNQMVCIKMAHFSSHSPWTSTLVIEIFAFTHYPRPLNPNFHLSSKFAHRFISHPRHRRPLRSLNTVRCRHREGTCLHRSRGHTEGDVTKVRERSRLELTILPRLIILGLEFRKENIGRCPNCRAENVTGGL